MRNIKVFINKKTQHIFSFTIKGSPIVDDGDDSLATSISLCTTIGAGGKI